MDSFNLLLAGIPMVVGAVIIALVLAASMKAKNAAKNWPTAQGMIESAELELQRGSRSGGVPSQYFKPQVRYNYRVGEQTYTGERLDFSSRAYQSEEKANQRLAAYRAGSEVTVHYDPADPSKAVLEATASGNGLVIVLGVALILAGVFFIV